MTRNSPLFRFPLFAAFILLLALISGCGSGGGNSDGSNENGSTDNQIKSFTRAYSFAEGLTPTGIAVAANGDVFLCFDTQGLVKFTNFGKPAGGVPQQAVFLNRAEFANSGLDGAAAIAVSPRDETVYVMGFMDQAHTPIRYIAAFSPEGKFLFRFKHAENSNREIDYKSDLAIGRSGKVYAKEYNLAKGEGVSVFDAQGNYLTTIQPPAINPADNAIVTFALDRSDNLYIGYSDRSGDPFSYDPFSDRLAMFSTSGLFVHEIVLKTKLQSNANLAIGNQGNFYISRQGYVQQASAEGKQLVEYLFPKFPSALALDASDNLYVNAGIASESDRISVLTYR